MKKIIAGDSSTIVTISGDEAKAVCKLGQDNECCAFLVVGTNGFECVRMAAGFSLTIMNRLDAGSMNARGGGGWTGCAWEGHGYPMPVSAEARRER